MSKKRALQTQVSSKLYDLLQELADLDSKSVSQLVRELIEQLEPGLQNVKNTILLTKSLNEDARKALIPNLERHADHIESSLQYGFDNMQNEITTEIKKQEKEKTDPPQYKLPIE